MDPLKSIFSQDIDKTVYEKTENDIHIHVTDNYESPTDLIKINDTTIATLGRISITTGKTKSYKTLNVSAVVASCLSGKKVLNYIATMPKGKEKVLYIDTEQSKYHCHKVLERILKLSELPLDKKPENLTYLSLREFTPDQRRQIISCAIVYESHIGLVVIDGIRDLLRDINNYRESLDVISDLMRWSSQYNVHVHTVLNLNKINNNISGYIGKELKNKAETILQVTKSIVDKNICEVKSLNLGDKDFEPFAFSINKDSLPEIVNNNSGVVRPQLK